MQRYGNRVSDVAEPQSRRETRQRSWRMGSKMLSKRKVMKMENKEFDAGEMMEFLRLTESSASHGRRQRICIKKSRSPWIVGLALLATMF